MSKIFPIIILFLISCSIKNADYISQTIEGEKTPLDLYYGMADWYNEKPNYSDSILDNIPGLQHKEFLTDICIPEDSIFYRNSLGIYLDKDFPSLAVRRSVFTGLDTMICQGISYEIEMEKLSHDLSQVESTDDFFNIWAKYYDNNQDTTKYNKGGFLNTRGVRVCVVAHKVASSKDWATYMMESTVDYHYSSGCNSEADYFTFDIATGRPLSIEEVLKIYPIENLRDKLKEAYLISAKERTDYPNSSITGEQLLHEADGAAIINEGLLIYFKPYKIGCGAEDQYNLILN